MGQPFRYQTIWNRYSNGSVILWYVRLSSQKNILNSVGERFVFNIPTCNNFLSNLFHSKNVRVILLHLKCNISWRRPLNWRISFTFIRQSFGDRCIRGWDFRCRWFRLFRGRSFRRSRCSGSFVWLCGRLAGLWRHVIGGQGWVGVVRGHGNVSWRSLVPRNKWLGVHLDRRLFGNLRQENSSLKENWNSK